MLIGACIAKNGLSACPDCSKLRVFKWAMPLLLVCFSLNFIRFLKSYLFNQHFSNLTVGFSKYCYYHICKFSRNLPLKSLHHFAYGHVFTRFKWGDQPENGPSSSNAFLYGNPWIVYFFIGQSLFCVRRNCEYPL